MIKKILAGAAVATVLVGSVAAQAAPVRASDAKIVRVSDTVRVGPRVKGSAIMGVPVIIPVIAVAAVGAGVAVAVTSDDNKSESNQ